MQDLLSGIYYSQHTPVLAALLLGLMTAIAPCPLTTNIAAIGFLSRDIRDRKRVFLNGVFYTLGLACSYMLLAVILDVGAGQLRLPYVIQRYSGKIFGPLLILVGLTMMDVLSLPFPQFKRVSEAIRKRTDHSYLHVVILGMVFAMAFCPYNGALYFGMLIPLTISTPGGLFLPLLFALAAGIPILIFAWLLAFTVGGVGKLYRRIQVFERWFRRIVALLFLGVGGYYTWINWILIPT